MPKQATAPAEWIETLERGVADVAAGRLVSGDEVEQRIRDSIARMDAKKAGVSRDPRLKAG